MTPDEQLRHAAAEYRKAVTARDESCARWDDLTAKVCRGHPCRDQVGECDWRISCADGPALAALDVEIGELSARAKHWRDAVLAAALIEGIDGRG